jgi:hypothetical protein
MGLAHEAVDAIPSCPPDLVQAWIDRLAALGVAARMPGDA